MSVTEDELNSQQQQNREIQTAVQEQEGLATPALMDVTGGHALKFLKAMGYDFSRLTEPAYAAQVAEDMVQRGYGTFVAENGQGSAELTLTEQGVKNVIADDLEARKLLTTHEAGHELAYGMLDFTLQEFQNAFNTGFSPVDMMHMFLERQLWERAASKLQEAAAQFDKAAGQLEKLAGILVTIEQLSQEAHERKDTQAIFYFAEVQARFRRGFKLKYGDVGNKIYLSSDQNQEMVGTIRSALAEVPVETEKFQALFNDVQTIWSNVESYFDHLNWLVDSKMNVTADDYYDWLNDAKQALHQAFARVAEGPSFVELQAQGQSEIFMQKLKEVVAIDEERQDWRTLSKEQQLLGASIEDPFEQRRWQSAVDRADGFFHDAAAPLGVMVGYRQLIEEDPSFMDNPQVAKMLDSVLAKAELVTGEERPAYLSDLVQNIEGMIEYPGVTTHLTMYIQPELDATAFLTKLSVATLERIINNALQNVSRIALATEGDVSREVEIEFRVEQDQVRLVIQDHLQGFKNAQGLTGAVERAMNATESPIDSSWYIPYYPEKGKTFYPGTKVKGTGDGLVGIQQLITDIGGSLELGTRLDENGDTMGGRLAVAIGVEPYQSS